MTSILKKYAYTPGSDDLYSSIKDTRFENLLNPGVQTNIIYMNAINTPSAFHYTNDPSEALKNNKIYVAEKIDKVLGDGTVETSS